MTTIDGDAALEGLEADGAWLHGLARSLCRDPERAADAAQATLVTALERPPEGGPRRSWLARVLRNRLVQDWRTDSRRTAREARSARSEEVPAADRTLARLELQERIAAAVRGLDEPYRTAVVLRYLDGQPPRRIAAETGVPVKTVKSRLERGLARLRARLDQDFGGERGRWMAALLALPKPPLTLGSLAGASAMATGLGTKIGVGAAVVVGVWLAVEVWRGDAVAGGDEPDVAGAAPPGVSADAALAPVENAPDPGTHEAGPSRAPVAAAAASVPSWSGRVVDAGGRPLSGVRVGVRRERDDEGTWVLAPRESSADGRLVWEVEEAPEFVRYDPFLFDSADERWAPLRREVARPDVAAEGATEGATDAEPPQLVVAPARPLVLAVVDAAGAPLADALLELELPPALVRDLDDGDPAGAWPRWSGRTAEDGRLALAALPDVDGVLVQASLGGYAPLEVQLEAGGADERTLVLERLEGGARVVHGRVLGPDGLPFEGARVAAGATSMLTGPTGWFAVPIPAEGRSFRGWAAAVHAVAPGLLPGEASLEGLEPGAFVELRLGGAPLTLRGRVTGIPALEGRAGERWRVSVWANGIAAFGMAPHELGNGDSYERYAFVEELLDPEPAPLGSPSAYVGEDGTFELRGLRDKEYTLWAFDKDTLALSRPVTVRAGADGVELVLLQEPAPLRVRGRVVDRRGQPVAGAEVSVNRPLEVDGYTYPGGASRRTAADGSFAFGDLAFDTLEVYVRGAEDSGVADRGFEFARDEAFHDLELVVGRTCRMRVVAEDALLAGASMYVVDAEGEMLSLERVDGNTRSMAGVFELVEGKSGVVHVEDSAHELVLRDATGGELRVPLALDPDEIVDVVVR